MLNKKVLMVTLTVCLILGIGIFVTNAWWPGTASRPTDFGSPWYTSRYRARATIVGSHAQGIGSFLSHVHRGTWYAWAEVDGEYDTPYGGAITLWVVSPTENIRKVEGSLKWGNTAIGCAIGYISLDNNAHTSFTEDHTP